MPFATLGIGVAISLALWQAQLRESRRKIAVLAEDQARATADAIPRARQRLTDSLAGVAARHAEMFRTHNRWTIELTGLRYALWVDPDGRAIQVVPPEATTALAGVDFRPSEAIRRAAETRQPASATSVTRPPAGDSLFDVVVPVEEGGRIAGFLVGVFSAHEIYRALLSLPEAASGWDLAVVEGDREVYRRGSFDSWAAETAIDALGVPTRLQVAPRAEVIARLQGNLPRVVLAAGLAIAVLLAVTVGLLQSAGRRGALAREGEDRHQRFFEANLAGAVLTDGRGSLVDANPAALRMLGFSSPGECLGRPFSSLFPVPARAEEILAALAAGDRIEQGELELRRADGRPVHVLANLVGRTEAGGRLAEVHAFLVDVTDKKRIEGQLRQAQKMDAIGRLAGGVAHDFNNLLSVITGYGELLERDLPREHPGRRRLREIRRAAESAATLTRQLLTFSRQQTVETRVLDLNDIVPNAQKMLGRLIGEHIDLVTALSPVLGRVRADAGQMEQVIMNLAINGRDAMPAGGKLMIETANVDLDASYAATHPGVAPGPYVMLAVSDTGQGMDAETIAHMFEPFFTTKEKGKGTGLGLATVYGIVQQGGGTVNVYSEPGHGTSFKVYLPRIEDAVAAIAASVAPPGGTETILLVEDSDSLREMVREVLVASGYAVEEAATPLAAGEAVRTGADAIDLLLTDVIMPGIAGPEIAARLRAANPSARVLYMSGYTEEMIGARGAIAESATHYLQKPFTFEGLLHKVREVLDAPAEAPTYLS
jgi:PAS domain S-box-containing protein